MDLTGMLAHIQCHLDQTLGMGEKNNKNHVCVCVYSSV